MKPPDATAYLCFKIPVLKINHELWNSRITRSRVDSGPGAMY